LSITRQPDQIVKVKFPITVSVLVGVMILILTVAYWLSTNKLDETIIFFTSASAAGAAIVTTYFAGKTLQSILNTRIEDLRRSRVECAMSFGQRWNDPSMIKVRRVISTINRMKADGKSPKKIKKYANKRTIEINQILNFWEEVALNIETGLADKELARMQFSGLVKTVWEALDKYVEAHRAARQRGGKPFAKIEALYKEWKK
jgi:hypothetical protein